MKKKAQWPSRSSRWAWELPHSKHYILAVPFPVNMSLSSYVHLTTEDCWECPSQWQWHEQQLKGVDCHHAGVENVQEHEALSRIKVPFVPQDDDPHENIYSIPEASGDKSHLKGIKPLDARFHGSRIVLVVLIYIYIYNLPSGYLT